MMRVSMAEASSPLPINVGPLNGIGSFCFFVAKPLREVSERFRQHEPVDVEWDLRSVEPRHMSMAGLTAFLATAYRLRQFSSHAQPVRVPWNPEVFGFWNDISLLKISTQHDLLEWPSGMQFQRGLTNPNSQLLMFPYEEPPARDEEAQRREWKDDIRQRVKNDLLLRCGNLFRWTSGWASSSQRLLDHIAITAAELVVNSLLWGRSAAFVGLQRTSRGISVSVCDSGEGFVHSFATQPDRPKPTKHLEALFLASLVNKREFGLFRAIEMVIANGGRIVLSSYDAELQWREPLWRLVRKAIDGKVVAKDVIDVAIKPVSGPQQVKIVPRASPDSGVRALGELESHLSYPSLATKLSLREMRAPHCLHHEQFTFTRLKALTWTANETVRPSLMQASAGSALAAVIATEEPTKPIVINCMGVNALDDNCLDGVARVVAETRRPLVFAHSESIEPEIQREFKRRQGGDSIGCATYRFPGQGTAVVVSQAPLAPQDVTKWISSSQELERKELHRYISGAYREFASGPQRMASTPILASGIFDAHRIISDPIQFVWVSVWLASLLEDIVEKHRPPAFRLLAVSLRASPFAVAIALLTQRHQTAEIVDRMGPKQKIVEEHSLGPPRGDSDYILVSDFIVGGTELKAAQTYAWSKGRRVLHALALGMLLEPSDYHSDATIASLVRLQSCRSDATFTITS